MDANFFSSHEIGQEMDQIEGMGVLLSQKLTSLEHTISYIFAQIKKSEDENTIKEYFDLLDRIQSGLALLVHRDDIGISDRLWRFMQDFDNFERAKEYYFEKIKNGEYMF